MWWHNNGYLCVVWQYTFVWFHNWSSVVADCLAVLWDLQLVLHLSVLVDHILNGRSHVRVVVFALLMEFMQFIPDSKRFIRVANDGTCNVGYFPNVDLLSVKHVRAALLLLGWNKTSRTTWSGGTVLGTASDDVTITSDLAILASRNQLVDIV